MSEKYIFYSLAFSGGLGGLAGVVLASGIYHKLVPSISGGYGFLSILIVLLAARNPLIVLLVSFIFGALLVGGSQLQLKLGLHSSLSGIIQASFVLVWLIIKSLNIKKMVLVTRSKKNVVGLEGYGIKISKQEIIK